MTGVAGSLITPCRRARRTIRMALTAMPSWRATPDVEPVIRGVLRALEDGGLTGASAWSILGGRSLGEGLALVRVGPRHGRPVAAVRLATSPGARSALARGMRGAEIVSGLQVAPETRRLLPIPLGHGLSEGTAWTAETFLDGRAIPPPIDEAEHHRQMALVEEALLPLQRAGAAMIRPDETTVDAWLDRRIRLLRTLLPDTAHGPAMNRIAGLLESTLVGGPLPVTIVHGDLWSGNVLVQAPVRGSGRPARPSVSGIVDWDGAALGELATHDHLHLALYGRKLLERRPLGHVVADAILSRGLVPGDAALLPGGGTAGVDPRAVLFLYWLRQVELNHLRNPARTATARWRAGNLEPVLACA